MPCNSGAELLLVACLLEAALKPRNGLFFGFSRLPCSLTVLHAEIRSHREPVARTRVDLGFRFHVRQALEDFLHLFEVCRR